MSRKKQGYQPENDEPVVDMSSLIDVVFLLLIYFIVTSTIAEEESDLILALPNDAAGSPDEIDPMFFVVAASGQIQRVKEDRSLSPLDGPGKGDFEHRRPEELPQLASDISEYKAFVGDEGIVKIKVDPAAKAQYVVDLLNILKANEITQITFTENE